MARLALTAGAPVVPMGVWGMERRWPRGGIKLGPPVRPIAAVAVGEPISAAGDAIREEDVRAMTDRAMAAIEALVDRARAMAAGS